MPRKLLLDTDIGSDIDDAVCLAYLLANPECELLGVTTVSGKPVERARLASALCKVASREVPIYPGLEEPLSGPQRQPGVQQAAVLPRWPHERDFEFGRAIDFMAETVRNQPGQVTLLSIGPMTNVASLFRQHPDVPGKLASLMLMSGRFGPKQPGVSRDEEWNVYCDPVAADIVYRTPVAWHKSVGLDVTMQVQMPAAEVRRRFSRHALLRPVLDMAEVHFRQNEVITFHDPLAAVCVFDASVCAFERGAVVVAPAGVTGWTPRPGGPHEVATQVDAPGFFDRYFGAFTG
jgi:inosine-uridine nucleoside N-ribohydrolase